jgi:hypothetical protein
VADHLVLLAPSSNRVYAGAAAELVAAELAILLGGETPVEPIRLAGVAYLALAVPELDERTTLALGRLSAAYAVFRREQDHLLPVPLALPDRFDDDLVTIPKYPGKTNEQFTRLLLNVTLASASRPSTGPLAVLDPMCGRGTTLSTALVLGHDAAGVESDLKAVEAYAAFLRTYLRRKRLKHTAGDTRQSAALHGRRRFDAVVVDAPYGIVHGSQATASKRDRSAAGLLAEALGVWAGQLKGGGALGISWNTLGLTRERLVGLAEEAGLEPLDAGPYRHFAHRVDSSIHRDVLVAVKPPAS